MQALHDTAGDNEPGIPAEVAQQAVQWWLTLRGAPVSARQRAAWQQWRAQSPEHEAAWQRIESVGRQMAGISLPLARATLAGPHAPRRRRSVQLLAGLVVAGGSFALLRQTPAWRAWAADEVAALGEQRRLALPDGGAVVLNTDSAINIRYGSAQRVVQLVRGEILVQTAADAQRRPFVVETALGRVRALGTRFTVRERAASVSVEVLQGAVELTPARAAQATQRLNAGEQGRFTALQAHSTGALDDAAGAWADGMLVAARMRLDDFLAELGRYRRGRLGCDPAVAHLRVSGAYPLADTDRVLAALTSALPVQVHFFSRYWVMVRPA
ncbi:MAG: FecR domain-containing protein [Comamonas sp.]|uniref:FecR domain-containing protein n=1 Tax=Comamonas sp. TaxID=34028 RepID=UPI002FCB5B73